MPYTAYLLVKNSDFKKGDYVGISGWNTKYTNDKHFTKRIVGVTGDIITKCDGFICINDKKIASLKDKTKNNEVLTPIESQAIPKRHYFVLAEHKDSFDSRYQEFGLVKHEYIEGKAIPLW